jgi:DHA1 family 2-module integral membrane pump EmrD-like MFS transporter
MCSLSARTVSVLFVLPLPGYLFGAWLSAKLSFRLSQGKLMRLGIVFLAGVAHHPVAGSVRGSECGLPGWRAAVYFIGSGILYPTATSCAIEPFPGQAGTAGAILGGMQNLGPVS